MTRIAVFASGSGSNTDQLIQHFSKSTIGTVVLVCCNKPEAGVVAKAEAKKVPLYLFNMKELTSGIVQATLKASGIDLIILAGFMRKIPDELLRAYPDRILNIHPSLLPKHGGKGMYGHYVHRAVLSAGEKESGITIHLVNEEYDKGRVLYQASCPVMVDDDPMSLQQRIQALEHEHFPQAVEGYIEELTV